MDADERVAAALACAAVDPCLAGVLLIGLDPAVIVPVADWMAALFADDDAAQPPRIRLGPQLPEEALWERIATIPSDQRVRERGGVEFEWAPGPLAGYDGRPPAIVVVPNLALLSVPAARAAVTLVGADVVHLERSGQSRRWRPDDWWLGGLRPDDAARVSPHLLDRFAVRVEAGALTLPGVDRPVLPALPATWIEVIRSDLRIPPRFTAAAADQVLALVPARAPGMRRDLALGRLARALAALDGQREVLPADVDLAAELAGLATTTGSPGTALPVGGTAGSILSDRLPQIESPAGPAPHRPGGHGADAVPGSRTDPVAHPDAVPAAADPADGRVVNPVMTGPTDSSSATGRLPVVPGEPESLPAEPADDLTFPPGQTETARSDPYPEDVAEPPRDANPLRLGWQRALSGPPRGQPIGTEPARGYRDIAILATLLHAARYQRLRPPWTDDADLGPIRVHASDLRSYRRAAVRGQLLVLVLDHTCRRANPLGRWDWDWYEPLAPYLRWAYVMRARVGVVEVGGAGAGESELRATEFRARGLLDPRVAAALEGRPGSATPLAHGLTLAAGMLRHDRQQGDWPASDTLLVVVTDALANVPLANSEAGTTPEQVGRKGVDDAIAVARRIHAIAAARIIRAPRRVHTVMIDPGTQPNGYLAVTLAEALGAQLVHGALEAETEGFNPFPDPAGTTLPTIGAA